ncbi:MAG: ADP-ribosylglycohydrolase family protein [Desulfohalobiaceae bacterium]|nr:ADP-ribosylglycohydrolase family protein [Desulfohalobiaceae bacterium]
MKSNTPLPFQSRVEGLLYGLCIGDALAMPVHWYYNRHALRQDYGWVEDYLTPHNPHPDSILWRSSYTAINAKAEILHEQAQYWGQKGIHYHQFLKAGENTLNVKICRLLVDSLNQYKGYQADDFLQRYIAFMTTPHSHRDTYIEECHRNFFNNYAAGHPPRQCGTTEKHIGGLVGLPPIVAFYADQPQRAREAALEHLALTHPGPKMETAGALLISILLELLQGKSLQDTLLENIKAQKSPLLGHPFTKLLKEPDEKVIGRYFSPACYVEDAVPAVLYLALKYHQDPESALIVNTNLGGDNAGRGSVFGSLLGAAQGIDSFPGRWVQGLVDPLPALARSEAPE